VVAVPARHPGRDVITFARFGALLSIVDNPEGGEHAVLSDGWRRIRIDVAHGSLVGDGPVLLHYLLHGVSSAEPRLIALRRWLGLVRTGRFMASLFPTDPRIERALLVLRVHDALADGASQRDIARALFGEERLASDSARSSDSLRSRVRRLVREARRMAQGGYRSLLRQ
jgi:hypothetical protein